MDYDADFILDEEQVESYLRGEQVVGYLNPDGSGEDNWVGIVCDRCGSIVPPEKHQYDCPVLEYDLTITR